MSYTAFAYQGLQLSSSRIRAHDKLRVQINVINTGDLGGAEVVQLYVHDPVASVTRPVKELRRFKRIHLAPSEQQTLTFEIRPEDLAFYGLDMRPIVEPGMFTAFVGGSSTSLIQSSFEVEGPSLRL